MRRGHGGDDVGHGVAVAAARGASSRELVAGVVDRGVGLQLRDLLVHAELLPRPQHGHVGGPSVGRGSHLFHHLAQLRVRARGVEDGRHAPSERVAAAVAVPPVAGEACRHGLRRHAALPVDAGT